jgi:hypothetical protein
MTDVGHFVWRRLIWQRPLDPSRVVGALRQWAADPQSPLVVIEARATAGEVTYLLGLPQSAIGQVAMSLTKLLGTSVLRTDAEREPVAASGRLKMSTPHRALRLDDPEAVVQAILAALSQARTSEQLVMQLVLGPRRAPLAIPSRSPSSLVAPWWEAAWHGDGGPMDSEKRRALRTKVADHGFACTVRLGVVADTRERQRALLLGLLTAIRTSEAAGVRLTVKREHTARLDRALPPWRWPLRLSVPELVGLTGWPLGDGELPGVPALHPRLLPPVAGTTGDGRVVASATAPGVEAHFSLSASNALQHLHVLGPTGTGKSTLLANLITQDIADGRPVVVVEPKGDLVDDVLTRIPAERHDDVVVLDPSDSAPVGLNPVAAHGRRPDLVADAVLAIFKQLYGSAVGPRSQDILYAGLLTLAQRGDASLVMLPLLLTNPGFRRSITGHIRDALTLEPFWAAYEAWSDSERATAIAPVMNKLRPLLRPGLRGVLGQRQPRFDIRQVFTERKVLLVPLRRGIVGPEAARLLGSLVVTEFWQAAQGRSAIAPGRRHPVMVYVDEVQDYLALPTDLGEALAQARGYGVAFTLAHQFLGQLSRDMRTGVLANARSRVCFQLPHEDAVVLAKGHDELSPADFMSLGRHEIYASLYANGQVTAFASGKSLPPRQAISDGQAIRKLSGQRYGKPLDALEDGFTDLMESTDAPLGATGRRRRPA